MTANATAKLWSKYDSLTTVYASSFPPEDRDDVQQELRIKMLSAIESYAKKIAEFKRSGKRKPVPLEVYLKLCMSNRVKDFYKVHTRTLNRLEFTDFSYNDDTQIIIEPQTVNGFYDVCFEKYTINGVSLLQGCKTRYERAVWKLSIKGYSNTQIHRVLKKLITRSEIDHVIERQKNFIKVILM